MKYSYIILLLSISHFTFSQIKKRKNLKDLSSIRFERFHIPSDDGLQSWGNIEKFYEDDDGIIWAMVNDGLYRYNGHSAINVTNYLSLYHNMNLTSQPTTQFLIDNNIIWHGQRKGLYKIDLNQMTSTKVFLAEPIHKENWVNYIKQLNIRNDSLYVGTANGLFIINKHSNKVLSQYLNNGIDVKHRESSNTVESIFPDIEDQAIWIALMSGMYRINKRDRTIKKYTIKNAPYPYPHNFHDGRLYDDKILLMPSHGLGMVEFDLKSKSFYWYKTTKPYKREQNVIRSAITLNDSISLVNVLQLGNALYNRNDKSYQWLKTPKTMKEGTFLNLDRSGFVWASKRGKIFRSTQAVVTPKQISNYIIDVSAFKANNTLICRPSIDRYLPINLNDEQRYIELDFSISKAFELNKVIYKYRLNQEKWQLITTPNSLKLFNLNSGNNKIEIRALSEKGKVLAERAISFNINLPFYKSIYFISIIILVLFIVIYAIIKHHSQQNLNKKLKELDKIKSKFFTNISHEFRTPLTLISNPIEATLEDNTISDKKRQQFETAKRNSERLLSLVNQLLDLSKIDAGQLKLYIQKSNIVDFIAALGESFLYPAEQKKIDFTLNIKQHTEDVYFDRDALEKIIINLLSNAIKYTPGKGVISCDTYIENDTLHLKIKNSGKGLSKIELKHLFQRFYQTNDQNQGTGIGLALVKELVDLHKGKIHVDSLPNVFTLFTVSLPVDKHSFKNEQFIVAKEDHTTITPITNKVNTVEVEEFVDTDQPILLLVEDNDDVRILLKQTFESTYNIIEASNGKKGIELALEHIPDLIISDLMMPIKDGIALTKALKHDERTSHVPIILLTAKAGDDNKLSGLEVGADDYITKPFNSKLLITKVAKLIENRRLLQQRYSQELVLYPKDISVTNIDEQFSEKVQTILDKNLVESSFSVTDFSKAAGMSRMQLHRKLKALTGLTATEFIRSQRLKLATKLLQTSDINISQVGYSVGFNDHSYFTKCFKDTYKCTPTEYAKRKS